MKTPNLLILLGVSSLTLVDVRQKMEQNLKRKKEKPKNNNCKRSKVARRPSENKPTEQNNSSSLSESDRQMLERWENMRKQTKPFIHPIRKYMKELSDLKDEALNEEANVSITASPTFLPAGSKIQQQFQFTHFVPQNQKGDVIGLKAIKMPSQGVPVTQTLHTGSDISQTSKFIRLVSFIRVLCTVRISGNCSFNKLHFQNTNQVSVQKKLKERGCRTFLLLRVKKTVLLIIFKRANLFIFIGSSLLFRSYP